MYKEIIREDVVEALTILNNDYDKALEFFNNLLEIDNNDVDALNGKGIALMKLEKYDEAESCFKSSVNIEENSVAYLNLGLINRIYDNLEESDYYFDKSSELNPRLKQLTNILRENMTKKIRKCSIINN